MDLSPKIRLDTKYLLALRIRQVEEDARAERPGCHLATNYLVDMDGRVWVHFTCVTHGQAWRELCAALDANGLHADPGIVLAEGNVCVASVGASDEDALRASGEELVPLEPKGA